MVMGLGPHQLTDCGRGGGGDLGKRKGAREEERAGVLVCNCLGPSLGVLGYTKSRGMLDTLSTTVVHPH